MTPTKQEPGQTFVVNVPDEFYTKAQAAAALQVTKRTIELWIAAGKLRASKPSFKILRIKRSEIDRFLDKYATA
jgi:excisionase family DNA binding protein